MSELEQLKKRVAALESLVNEIQSNQWMSPNEAAPILGISGNTIRLRIRECLTCPQRSPLKPGVHFKTIGMSRTRATYKINTAQWNKLNHI